MKNYELFDRILGKTVNSILQSKYGSTPSMMHLSTAWMGEDGNQRTGLRTELNSCREVEGQMLPSRHFAPGKYGRRT